MSEITAYAGDLVNTEDMTITENLERIINAKEAIRDAIVNKGGQVAEDARIDQYPAAIEGLPSGGEYFANDYIMTFTSTTTSDVVKIEPESSQTGFYPDGKFSVDGEIWNTIPDRDNKLRYSFPVPEGGLNVHFKFNKVYDFTKTTVTRYIKPFSINDNYKNRVKLTKIKGRIRDIVYVPMFSTNDIIDVSELTVDLLHFPIRQELGNNLNDITFLPNYFNGFPIIKDDVVRDYALWKYFQINTKEDWSDTVLHFRRIGNRGCNYMFYGNTSIKKAPDISADEIYSYGYQYMYSGCTNLTHTPSVVDINGSQNIGICTSMFSSCKSLTTAPTLPSLHVPSEGYKYMFQGCSALTTAPELPATTLSAECYYAMFQNCTSLINPPSILPVTTLPAPTLTTKNGCYQYMFQGCTSLTTAPALPATTLATDCYYYMFDGCTSLTTAPALPATTMQSYCYAYMFRGCKSLTEAPDLPAITLQSYSYNYMFKDCTALQKTGKIAATGSITSNAGNMFSGCTSLREMTWTATTPPAIASGLWSGCPTDMIIYVPDASVDKYKAASVWSSRANYIKGISEKPTE